MRGESAVDNDPSLKGRRPTNRIMIKENRNIIVGNPNGMPNCSSSYDTNLYYSRTPTDFRDNKELEDMMK